MEVNDNNDNTNLTAILMSIMLNHSTIYSASNQTTVSDFVVMKFLDCLSYFFVFHHAILTTVIFQTVLNFH